MPQNIKMVHLTLTSKKKQERGFEITLIRRIIGTPSVVG